MEGQIPPEMMGQEMPMENQIPPEGMMPQWLAKNL
jgi:hypothetical protein